MKLVFDKSRMAAAALMTDEAFADWFVDHWMEIELKDFKYRQDDAVLKGMTISARNYARHFGINDPESQVQFVHLCWELGPGFFLFPGFLDIAVDRNLSGPDKIEAFYNMPEDQAVDVMLGRNSSHWFDAPLPELR